MWSCVDKEAEPRWFGHAIDHQSGTVLAYGFGGEGYTLAMGMAGEELPAKATAPALQLLSGFNAPTSPVHSPAQPAAPGLGSTRATGVSRS